MDPPLINESSFTAANPAAYSLVEMWPFGGEAGLRTASLGGGIGESSGNRDRSLEESTVTEQSGGGGSGGRKRKDVSSEDEFSRIVSTSSGLNDSSVKRVKLDGLRNEDSNCKAEAETSSGDGDKAEEQSTKPSEPPKQDYIHVRARRGQATDSHSLAERARREKISERMKILQDLVPGCNKLIGKALVLDEIINYIESLQRQVEFLSLKLEAVNARVKVNPSIESFASKDDCYLDPTHPGSMPKARNPNGCICKLVVVLKEHHDIISGDQPFQVQIDLGVFLGWADFSKAIRSIEILSLSAAATFTSSSGMYSTPPSVRSSNQPCRSEYHTKNVYDDGVWYKHVVLLC